MFGIVRNNSTRTGTRSAVLLSLSLAIVLSARRPKPKTASTFDCGFNFQLSPKGCPLYTLLPTCFNLLLKSSPGFSTTRPSSYPPFKLCHPLQEERIGPAVLLSVVSTSTSKTRRRATRLLASMFIPRKQQVPLARILLRGKGALYHLLNLQLLTKSPKLS